MRIFETIKVEIYMKFLEINFKFREWLRNKKWLYIIENTQLMAGFFGVLYGIIFLFYFYAKINKNTSLFFILPIFIGISLIISTKRSIIKDEKRENKFPI